MGLGGKNFELVLLGQFVTYHVHSKAVFSKFFSFQRPVGVLVKDTANRGNWGGLGFHSRAGQIGKCHQ